MSTSLYHPATAGEGALAGIKVIDCTGARAGPNCIRQVADLGADVIQVAAPGRGDLSGSDAVNLHRNKRSMILDLRQPAGREILLRLVRQSDVFVENFRPDVKHRLGIGPETLLAENPRLIYASISGFGQDGPYADRPGVDQIAQGLGGLMSVTGPPGGGPWRAGIAVADLAAGMFLTQGILAALLARARTGRGQWVHTSLLESIINMMDFQAARWLVDRDVPGQAGNHHPSFPLMATYRTADGHVNLAPITGFESFCGLIGCPDLAADPRFCDARQRDAHQVELHAAIEEITRQRTTAAWIEHLATQIPCGPVLAMDQVFADPQVGHLNMSRRIADPTGNSYDVLRQPLTFSDTPVEIRSGVTLAGRESRAILRELGYEADAIEIFLSDGVVAASMAGNEWGG